MIYKSISNYVSSAPAKRLQTGPVAIVFCEDDSEIETTVAHNRRLGFANILLLMPADLELPQVVMDSVDIITSKPGEQRQVFEQLNRLIVAFDGRWIYYCFNSEFLLFPFCETRSVRELIDFMAQERRSSVFSNVIDLYTKDLETSPLGVTVTDAFMDRSGYFAESRNVEGQDQDRQIDIFGGLKWRFEEHFPASKRRINRVSLFLAKGGLKLDNDLYFNDPEYNTFACAWHHNATAAICSFRAAKYLKRNPVSKSAVKQFHWSLSQKFEWNSQQLMDMGLIEPGQWF